MQVPVEELTPILNEDTPKDLGNYRDIPSLPSGLGIIGILFKIFLYSFFFKKKNNKPNKNRFIACLHFDPLLLNYSEKLERSYMQKRMKRGSRGETRNHKMINKVPLKEGHNHTLQQRRPGGVRYLNKIHCVIKITHDKSQKKPKLKNLTNGLY